CGAPLSGVSVLAALTPPVRRHAADDLGRLFAGEVSARRLVRAAGRGDHLLYRGHVARGAGPPLPDPIRLDHLQDSVARLAPDRGIREIASDVVLLDLVHLHEARRLRGLLDERGGAVQDSVPDLA